MAPHPSATTAAKRQQKNTHLQATTSIAGGLAKLKLEAGQTKAKAPGGKAAADDGFSSSSSISDSDSDDEDVEANLEMDGQDLWTQNYCSVCDTLIAPGSGVGSRRPSAAILHDSSQSTTPAAAPSSPVLRSKTGTIKARPTSSDGKRASGSGSSGMHLPSGRLNALSDLKPVTKVNPVAGPGAPQQRSPKTSRRSSGASTKSAASSSTNLHKDAATASETPALARSRKGGLLGALSPAALKQQQEESLKANAPPALYCSERCRSIDEASINSRGLAELTSYATQQPYLPPAWAAAQASPVWPPVDGPYQPKVWPRTPSMTSLPTAYGQAMLMATGKTPDSEYAPCMCIECLEKNSASGTVPSGASDTTESSNGLPHQLRSGGSSGYRKQRSQSGRILTPQGLHPPACGADCDGYFPAMASQTRPSRRHYSVDSEHPGAPERAPSVASEESSTQSSASYASMWEPKLNNNRPVDRKSDEEPAPRRQQRRHSAQLTAQSPDKRISMISQQSIETSNGTHGTVTPADGTLRQRVPSMLGARELPADATSTSAMSGSLAQAAGPLRLLRPAQGRGSTAPSADSANEQACSYGSKAASLTSTTLPFGSSITSEQTLGTSANTLVHRNSASRERRQQRGLSLTLTLPSDTTGTSSSARAVDDAMAYPRGTRRGLEAEESGVSGLSQSYAGSIDAMSSLRAAANQSRNGRPGHSDERRRSSANLSTSSTNSAGWLRSLSSAWTSLRLPSNPSLIIPGANNATQEDGQFTDARRPSAYDARNANSASSYNRDQDALQVSTDGSGRPSPSDQGNASGASSYLSRSAASESLSRMLSASTFGSGSGRSGGSSAASVTPSDSKARSPGVARPGVSRGHVPAFASEIGQGQIPGEASMAQTSEPGIADTPPRRSESTGPTGTLTDSERRRRRRADHRHQRSKDVAMLPPLLAPSNRSSSGLNLLQYNNRANSYANLHGAHQVRNKARSSWGSNSGSGHAGGGATFVVGSAGSFADRPNTPATNYGDGEEGNIAPLPHVASSHDLYRSGTSPRRSGFGWSAMTPIKDSTPVSPDQQQHHAHGGTQRLGGPSQAGQYPHLPHHHHPHHHHQQQQLHHIHHSHRPSWLHNRHSHNHAPHPQQSAVQRGLHVGVGHIGMLGYHPHGSQPAYGRHNTMPVRTSTPIVPEDGGEMSGAALTGQYDISEHHQRRPTSAMGQRHRATVSTGCMAPPLRPRSSAAHRGHPSPLLAAQAGMRLPTAHLPHGMLPPPTMLEQSGHTWSYESLTGGGNGGESGSGNDGCGGGSTTAGGGGGGGGVKTYPVLHVPGREQTHDRYDDAWSDAFELIAGPKAGELVKQRRQSELNLSGGGGGGAGAGNGAHAPSSTSTAAGETGKTARPAYGETVRRKQLFHFGP